MIKPGTLCIMLPLTPERPMRLCTVVSGQIFIDATDVQTGEYHPARSRYFVDIPDTPTGNAFGPHWAPEASRLRPLNDPDSAPAGPAYTKRKEHA